MNTFSMLREKIKIKNNFNLFSFNIFQSLQRTIADSDRVLQDTRQTIQSDYNRAQFHYEVCQITLFVNQSLLIMIVYFFRSIANGKTVQS